MANLIINEFLTFVQNKIDSLDEVSIIQICATNFTDSEIEEGKNVLFNCCDCGRNVQRKGDDRNKKNIKDVIKVLKEIDPQVQPNFVAKDLNRLPPVTFDHVDVTRLLKDMLAMKSDLTELRQKLSTDMTELRSAIELQGRKNTYLDCTLSDTANATLRPRRSSSPLMFGPHHNTQLSADDDLHSTARKTKPSYRDMAVTSLPPPPPPPPPSKKQLSRRSAPTTSKTDNRAARVGSQLKTVLPLTNNGTIASTGSVQQSDDNNEPFRLVSYKKRKSKTLNMRGTLIASERIQVVEPQVGIYVSRAKKCVTEANIADHINDMGETCLSVTLLKQSKVTDFNSFKVIIPSSKQQHSYGMISGQLD